MPTITLNGVSHAERIHKHRLMMFAFGAPLTRENLTRLADDRARTARKLRLVSTVSQRSYEQRAAALHSARAFYALARQAARREN